MKSYRQYCGLALALDQVGERWTLLIVRELLTGPKRYADLQEGLPGVATNLLAARLKSMERAGLVERQVLLPPAAASVYALTRAGADLRQPLQALVRWGGRFMRSRSRGQAFRPDWLGVALDGVLSPACLPRRPLLAQIELPEGTVMVRFGPDVVRLVTDRNTAPDVRIRASAPLLLGLAVGEVTWHRAVADGMDVKGGSGSIGRFRSMLSDNIRSVASSNRADD